MISPRVLAAVAALVATAEPPTPLQVLTTSPGTGAGPTAPIQVIFDRPVAGSLDRTVDPAAIFRIEPEVPGRVEWRDPVTLRFLPAGPLTPGRSFTVTIANSFEAMDGSRLAQPFRYSFEITGPQLLGGLPVNANEHPAFLSPAATFEVVFSAPLDGNTTRGLAYLDFGQGCGRPGVVKLNVTGQRPVTDTDAYQYRDAGGWERDRSADPLRRVVSLKPERPLPLGCAGDLVIPTAIDPEGTRPFARWGFSTYGALRLLGATCAGERSCPAGGVRVRFATPVKGAEVARRLSLLPPAEFSVADTADESDQWYLETQLKPNTPYAVVADTGLRDVFGQRLTGNNAAGFRTTGYAPLVEHEYGRMTVERAAFRTLAVRHVNVDTLVASIAPVSDRFIPAVLSYTGWNRDDRELAPVLRGAVRQKIAVPGPRDRVRIYGLKLPLYNAQRASAPTLQLVRVTSLSLDSVSRENVPWAVVQVTDLAVHARVGVSEGVVWVTGVSDGLARAGATITLYDMDGRSRATARSNAEGVAVLGGFRPDSAAENSSDLEGYVVAVLGNDKALTAISQYDPDLSPWQFNVRSAWGDERVPAAAAVFTERGIYRPGEPVYAKAIVRTGPLGQLAVPARGDSLRWLFQDREGGTLREATVAPSPFGTSDQAFTLPADLALGSYEVKIQRRRRGAWADLAAAGYRVAEYRAPQFLVDVAGDSAARFPGDDATARVEARYLFGAPMGRAALTWVARETTLDFWALDIPHTEGFALGENGWWWEDYAGAGGSTTILGQGSDTLDAAGRAAIRVALAAPEKGRPARATIEATVIDVNRQSVAAATSFLVHPASFYLGAKPVGTSYFWTAGKPQAVAVIAVRPDGVRVPGVRVSGTVVRREWHRVHRTRAGYSEVYGEWVADTVGHCTLITAAEPVECRVTPAAGGTYIVSFAAEDEARRPVSASIYRWAVGKDWVPWNDESQFKLDLVPDRTRYSVGDTASVLVASPFTDAEAWVTVEREGLIEQRRMRLTSGTTTLRFPVTEAWAPNAFVSVLVTRGRSAPPGPLDDPGRPTLRVGYAEMRVTPEVKRLTVEVAPALAEYRPGDTARVRLTVRDRLGHGQRSEVTLWAVDEGVLALTGYRTPDPIDLLYAPRGLGLRLASNLATVAPQVPEGEKGGRAPGGGGGLGDSDVLRSQFKTTAFFLGSVVTDSAGTAVAKARLPDNLTTFRLMAVAVTAGDRYGSGQAPMLVTRPLLARPALPRFLREGDRFMAGVVVNQRAGGTPTVTVAAESRGAALSGDATRTAVLEAGRGREVRFDFRQPGAGPLGAADSSTFRFRVTGAGDADAVQQRLVVKPAFRPRAWTVAGLLHDTATAEILVPDGLDPERSRLTVTLGSSPLGVIRGLERELRVYPYYCTEQLSSAAQPLIALYRAQRGVRGVTLLRGNPRKEIETAVATLSRRQRADGGIGFWSSDDWTTPWLSTYAGLTLLEARAAGITVNDSVLARLAEYLRLSLTTPTLVRAPVVGWYDSLQMKLSDQVAAADYLSRYGRPEVASENELLRNAAQLGWEDRARLAEILARRKAFRAARALLQPAWSAVKVEGRRAVLPEQSLPRWHYFYSHVRPIARLLTATLAVDSASALIGPLVETLVQQGRAGLLEPWNTQDYAVVVGALSAVERRIRAGAARPFSVQAGGRTLLRSSGVPLAAARMAMTDSTVPLAGLLADAGPGRNVVRLGLAAEGAGAPIYYYLTISEVPKERPVRPEEQGIRVERWYERYDAPTPLVSVNEGELVRVRLRITVPADRQFVVVDDALPAGLEAIDLSLRTASLTPGPGVDAEVRYLAPEEAENTGTEGEGGRAGQWFYGSWDMGWWSPWDHRELRDERVMYSATVLWRGTYSLTYLARATTPGVFVRPPAHAEEMYNPAVYGRSDGGLFTVVAK